MKPNRQWNSKLPLTIKSYDEKELDKRIEDTEKRGYILTSRGHVRKDGYTMYWARLKEKERVTDE